MMKRKARRPLARAYVDAYKALLAVEAKDPDPGDANRDAVETPEAQKKWLRWYRDEYQPASKVYKAAVSAYADAVGSESRHPFNLVPLAEADLR